MLEASSLNAWQSPKPCWPLYLRVGCLDQCLEPAFLGETMLLLPGPHATDASKGSWHIPHCALILKLTHTAAVSLFTHFLWNFIVLSQLKYKASDTKQMFNIKMVLENSW